MSKHTFIWQNDTLYLLDDYNQAAAKLIRGRPFRKKISTEEYSKKLKEVDESKYPFTPKFEVDTPFQRNF